MSQDLSTAAITTQLKQLSSAFKHYYGIAFVVFVAGVYFFLITQTTILVNDQPDETEIKADTVKKLLVKDDIAEKLKDLHDNNISVQTAIDEERKNPFQEQD